jgi:threonyl-tRNA synthetase
MNPSLDAIRQATAEILAYTIRDIVPDTLLVKGQRTDIGFHYDFILKHPLDKESIPVIEERMRINIKKSLSLKTVEMMRENAASLFHYHGQAIQANVALQSATNILTICQIDTFYDNCLPPCALVSTDIAAFKILSITKEKVTIAGSGNLEVTRIAGTAFHDKDTLKKFVKKLEEAKKYDHVKLGKEKNFFLMGKMPVWLPRGVAIRETLIQWWKREVLGLGYSFVKATSHTEVLRHFTSSYKNLPVYYAELTDKNSIVEQEMPETLFNAPVYTHDIATTFCTPDQVKEEINKSLQFIRKTSTILGFGHQWYLVTQNNRDKAIEPLVEGLKQSGIDFSTEIHKASGVRGPRIEVRWVDFLGREWAGPTLTLDYHSSKVDLSYQTSDSKVQHLVMITCSVFGSLERCIALLVEHYALQKENVAQSFEQQ